MARITKLKIKDSGNSNGFIEYPIGADASNIYYGITPVSEKIGNLEGSISLKAPINHRSVDTTYGVGTDNYYGHLRISDEASEDNNSSDTALSTTGALALLETIQDAISANSSAGFEIVNIGDSSSYMLYSAANTAFYDEDYPERLTLVPLYFILGSNENVDLSPNGEGDGDVVWTSSLPNGWTELDTITGSSTSTKIS